MAVWQYDIALVPRSGVIREHGIIPDELPGYRAVWNPQDQVDQAFPNYWEGGIAPESLSGEVEAFLPMTSSWSADAVMYGDAVSHRIEIWRRDSIKFRFDVRRPDLHLLQYVVDFARRHDLLMVPDSAGHPMEPSFDRIIADIRGSDAYSFCKDPDGFLNSLKNRLSEQNGAGMGGSAPGRNQPDEPAASDP